jgi:hypothetical protein
MNAGLRSGVETGPSLLSIHLTWIANYVICVTVFNLEVLLVEESSVS